MSLRAAALLALAAAGPGSAATLPGWVPGSLALAGPEAIVTQVGPVRNGVLTYHRTDAWRVALSRGGRAGDARRVITVRTSAGPMAVGPVSGNRDGTFLMVAPGRAFAGPVVWCCDRRSTLQEVLESDGRSEARRPLAAAGQAAGRRAWLVRTGDGFGVANESGPMRWLSSVPTRDLAAIGPAGLAWIEGPPYNRGEYVVAEATAGGQVRRAPLAGRARGVWVVPATSEAVAVVQGPTGWSIVRTGRDRTRTWQTPRRPIVAAGGSVLVVVANGRLLRWNAGAPAPTALGRFQRQVRSLATDGRRVAWTEWDLIGGRRRTSLRWRDLD